MFNNFNKMKNNKKEILLDLNNNTSFKIFLYAFITIMELNEINKVLEVNTNYEELESILKINEPEIIKFLYFNKDNVHQILYENEIIININLDDNKKSISYIFYLSLLIMDNIDIVNYSYKIDYIRKINDYYRNEKDKYLLIIASKIIIDLINNFKGTEDYDKYENELNSIIEERKKIINNNIDIFNEINLNINIKDLLSKKIDEIYIEIIKALFMSKKFDEDYSYISNIIDQLDLININITKTIYNGILELLNNSFIISEYIILKEEDLRCEKKIIFYFFLLKYILKNSIYIYQIPFLLKTRELFKEILKSNKSSNDYFISNNNEKLLYVIKTILDSDYYVEKINLIIKLKEILNYYKEFLNEIKKDDIIIIENIINNNKKSSYNEYLIDYEQAKEMNLRLLIIKYLHSNINENNTFTDTVENWSQIEKMIHEKKIENIEKKYKDILIKYFKDINNKEYLLKIFSQDSINFFINPDENIENNNNLSNINDLDSYFLVFGTLSELHKAELDFDYYANLSNESKEKIEEKKGIYFDESSRLLNTMMETIESLFNDIFPRNSEVREDENNTLNYKQFLNLINKFEGKKQIKDNYNLKIEGKIDNIYNIAFIFLDNDTNIQYKKNISIDVTNINLKDFENIIFIIRNKNGKLIDKDYYKIYQNNLIQSFELKYIKKLRNGYYLNWGEENNYLNIYDKCFNKIKSINIEEIEKPILNILELTYNEDLNKERYLIICSQKYYQASFINNQINNQEDNNEYLDYKYLLENKVINNSYKHKNLLKIDEDFIILMSRKKNNEEDALLFYNINNKKIIKEINTYPFANTPNNFLLITKEDQNKINRIFLCACNESNQYQRNGILLIDNININQEISQNFHDTQNFEPYCFCPLLINDNKLLINEEDNCMYKTIYLLVGGFDSEESKGKIKVYKIIYSSILRSNTVEYYKDIIFVGNKVFEYKITFITQLEDDGGILFISNKELYKFYLS